MTGEQTHTICTAELVVAVKRRMADTPLPVNPDTEDHGPEGAELVRRKYAVTRDAFGRPDVRKVAP